MNRSLVFISLIAAISGCGIVPAQSEAVVAIFKSANSIQCETKSGVSALTLRRELENLNIVVFDYKRLSDGMAYQAVCGAPTGFIHVFTIARGSLLAAEAAGFKRLSGGVE